MRKNSILLVVFLCILIASGLFIYKRAENRRSSQAFSSNLVYTVQKGSIDSTISAVGQVQSTDTREITALTGSTVKKIVCSENQVVKKGDILFVLTNDSADLELERAKITLSQQQNQLVSLKNQQRELLIKAPASGIIRMLSVGVGDSVSVPFGMPGSSALVQLEDTSVMKFTIFSSPSDSGKSMKGPIPGNQKINVNFQGVGVRECSVSSANVNSQGSSITFQVLKTDGLIFGNFYTISIPVMPGMEIPITAPIQVVGSFVSLNAKQNGTVTKVYVKVGDNVKLGQELIVTSSDSLTNQIQMAELSIKSAQLNVNQQQKQVENLIVKAPMDGVVYNILAQEGSVIGSIPSKDPLPSPTTSQSLSGFLKNQAGMSSTQSMSYGTMSGGQAIATIENQSSRKVSITIDELDIGKIKVNQKAKITLDAFSDRVFSGYVSSLSSIGIVQNGSATFKADILIDSTEKMMTGMSATVSILTDSKKNILILPIDAIFSKNERRYVFIESLKGLMEQDIQVGIVNEDYAEILMGLKEKDIVLVPIQDSMLFNNSGNSSGTTPRFPMMPGPSNHSNPFNQP